MDKGKIIINIFTIKSIDSCSSRSPAIVIAYLMRSYHVSLEECLMHVIKARPCVIPNDGFLKQLILYDRFLVERRRQQRQQQEEEARRKASEVVLPASTEIPMQHHSVVPTNPPAVEINIAPSSTPPINSQISEPQPTHISSIDSSSLATSSASGIESSSSTNSVHVIPIQVSAKEVRRHYLIY